MSPAPKPGPRTCRYHCSSCGCHFSSLDAFDLHRRHERGEHPTGGWSGILRSWCGRPGSHGLEPKTGECRMGPRVIKGISIWGVKP